MEISTTIPACKCRSRYVGQNRPWGLWHVIGRICSGGKSHQQELVGRFKSRLAWAVFQEGL